QHQQRHCERSEAIHPFIRVARWIASSLRSPRNDECLTIEHHSVPVPVMRLRIAHPPSYRSDPPAPGVIQILRMTPGSHDGQYVAKWQIDVSTDSRLDVHQDAFGNVTHVLTHGPIADLTIHVEGLIETHDTGGVLKGTDERFPPSFFLRSTPLTEVNPAMANFARELRAESENDVLGFLHALMMQINEHMTFDEDPTNSSPSAIEAFGLKRGVSEDYAH